MVPIPGWSEKSNDTPNDVLSRSHDTHPQVELDGIALDGRRLKVKLQVVITDGNRHCLGTRKLCEGEGQYWMGLSGGCFWL